MFLSAGSSADSRGAPFIECLDCLNIVVADIATSWPLQPNVHVDKSHIFCETLSSLASASTAPEGTDGRFADEHWCELRLHP